MEKRRAGTAYVALPDSEQGPGVLVLHAWWGLTPAVKHLCDRLAEEGFVALAPDLFDGAVAETIADGERLLAEADADAMAHLTRSGLAVLRGLPATPDLPVGVMGLSMGGSLALWLAARTGDEVAATVSFYGGQEIDMADATSAFLGHYADVDAYVDDDGLALLEAELHLDGLAVEFHRYEGTSHWFFEPDRPEHHPEAAALAWERTLTFLRAHLA
ncbi:MAG: dienelactone hydrolase family protein [Acidimicrobiales bacterium]